MNTASPANASFLKKLIFGEAIYTSLRIAGRPIEALTSFIVIGALSLSEYGIYKLAVSVFALLQGFAFEFLQPLVLNEILLQRTQGAPERARRLYTEFVLFQAIVGLVLFLIAVIGAQQLALRAQADIAPYVRMLAFLFPVTALKAVVVMHFEYTQRFKWSSAMDFVYVVAKLMFVGGTILTSVLTLSRVVFINVFTQWIVFGLFLLPFIRFLLKDHALTYHVKLRGELLRVVKTQAIWSVARQYVGTLIPNARTWFVRLFTGNEGVAIFSVATTLLSFYKSTFSFRVLGILLPKEAAVEFRLRRIFIKGGKYLAWFYTVLFLGSLVATPMIVKLLFPKYVSALPIFAVMAISMMFFGLQTIAGKILYTWKRQRDLFLGELVKGLATLILLPVALRGFGLMGTAIEFLLTQALVVVVYAVFIIRQNPKLHWSLTEFFTLDSYDRELLQRGKALVVHKISQYLRFRRA